LETIRDRNKSENSGLSKGALVYFWGEQLGTYKVKVVINGKPSPSKGRGFFWGR